MNIATTSLLVSHAKFLKNARAVHSHKVSVDGGVLSYRPTLSGYGFITEVMQTRRIANKRTFVVRCLLEVQSTFNNSRSYQEIIAQIDSRLAGEIAFLHGSQKTQNGVFYHSLTGKKLYLDFCHAFPSTYQSLAETWNASLSCFSPASPSH